MSQRRRFVSLHTVYGRRIPAACGPFRTAPRGGGPGGPPRWALVSRSTLATETRASAARDAGARRRPPERSRERWSPRPPGRFESRGRCRPARRGVVGHAAVGSSGGSRGNPLCRAIYDLQKPTAFGGRFGRAPRTPSDGDSHLVPAGGPRTGVPPTRSFATLLRRLRRLPTRRWVPPPSRTPS